MSARPQPAPLSPKHWQVVTTVVVHPDRQDVIDDALAALWR